MNEEVGIKFHLKNFQTRRQKFMKNTSLNCSSTSWSALNLLKREASAQLFTLSVQSASKNKLQRTRDMLRSNFYKVKIWKHIKKIADNQAKCINKKGKKEHQFFISIRKSSNFNVKSTQWKETSPLTILSFQQTLWTAVKKIITCCFTTFSFTHPSKQISRGIIERHKAFNKTRME